MTHFRRNRERTDASARWSLSYQVAVGSKHAVSWGRVDVALSAMPVLNAPNAPQAYRAADTIWR